MKNNLKKLTTLEDNFYRIIKDMSINKIIEKYPDKVVDVWVENGRAVLQLDTLRIKYNKI